MSSARFYLALVFMLVCFSAIPAFAELQGFRGIQWGTSFDEVAKTRTMVLSKEDAEKEIVIYGIENDPLALGDAELQTIQYFFWRNKLMMVLVVTNGEVNYLRLRANIIEKFGDGRSSGGQNPYNLSYKGDITNVNLTYQQAPETGIFYLISKEMARQHQKALQSAGEQQQQ
ncbi:hypothetical protein [Desulforhopalus singaporensis]|uniref:Uncharacterized protein n=1 Tax=Desulforhopalus singaporensis TaxID=91360 RepID=A0A1H0VIY3_9BACT|nr:hypothetical protein [Desulforhopalus singaporensis]SDP78542.1 hypothetical protein SAMN05660330_04101 [Desulforhopalus singaporensis]